jgi:hypothetical protein
MRRGSLRWERGVAVATVSAALGTHVGSGCPCRAAQRRVVNGKWHQDGAGFHQHESYLMKARRGDSGPY